MEAMTAPKTLEEILGRTPEDRRQEVLLSIRDLRVHFPAGGGTLWDRVTGGSATPQTVKAVDGVTLDIYEGESLGLVGESGCGKTTLGRAILRLLDSTSGTIFLRDISLTDLSDSEMRPWRRHLQMIFQDPYSSLNPRMTVGQIVGEPLETFNLASGQAAERWVQSLLEMVGLNKRFVKRYPHEFSGGQRQRIGIARALAASPDLIVADEPISALDVSIQAQVMNLLKNLQKQKTFACLFISHDLRAVRHFSDRIAVMYLGRIVEIGKASEVYEQPLMPYTQALISAVPVPDPTIEKERQRIALPGEAPSALNPPTGCHFHPRCPYAIEACSYTEPELLEIKPGHYAACIRISREQPIIEEAKEFVANMAALNSSRQAVFADPVSADEALLELQEERRRAHEEALLQQKEVAETARLTALAGEKQEDEEHRRRREAEQLRVLEAEANQGRETEARRRREAAEEARRRIDAKRAAIRAEQEQIRQLEVEIRRREAEEAGRQESANQELAKLRLQAEEAERLRQDAEAAVRRAEDERKQLTAQTGNLPFAEAKAVAEETARRQKVSEEAARKAVEARLAQMDIQRRQRDTEARLQREEKERLQHEERERLHREEEIRQRQTEIERLLLEAEEQRKLAEAERMRQDEEERLRLKAEEERRLREAEEEGKRLEAEKLERGEAERLRQLEAYIERERQKSEEEARQKLLEAERLQQMEYERLELQAAEETHRRAAEEASQLAEKERFQAEEAERLRRVEEEVRRHEETERQQREAELQSHKLNEQRLRDEQELMRSEEIARQKEAEANFQEKLDAERQRLEEEKMSLEESRRRAEAQRLLSNAEESATLAAKNDEETERLNLIAEVERLKREAAEALRRQREAEEALRKEKRLTGELDNSLLRTSRSGNLGSLVTPEPIDETSQTESDRRAAVMESRPNSTLFSNQTVPSNARGVGGKGVALIALGAVALIGLLFWAAAKYAGASQSVTTNVSSNPTNANTNNNPEIKASNPQNPPSGMVYLPGGTFKMGRNDGDDYEKPAHDVTIKPIFIDIYEVTNAEYLKFVEATGYKPPLTWKGNVIPEGGERKPVTNVNYYDAEAYAKWAGKRLPTEEEWEYAARGNDGRLFPWGGDKWDKDKALANANATAKSLTDVGSYKDGVSPFGIYDMAGNAWEWTSTPLAAYPEGKLPEVPVKETMVIRGGCYLSGLDGVAATYRGFVRKTGEESYKQTGFRCVKDLD